MKILTLLFALMSLTVGANIQSHAGATAGASVESTTIDSLKTRAKNCRACLDEGLAICAKRCGGGDLSNDCFAQCAFNQRNYCTERYDVSSNECHAGGPVGIF